MAGSTEQEQIKSNQLLEKVERSTTETAVAMNSLIDAVKQPSEYEKIAEGIADETKKLHETAEKHDKDRAKADDKFHKDFTSYAKDSTDSDKSQAVHNKFIQDTEKRKEGLAKMAFAFQQRAAKLATRGLDKSWDWTKDKVKGVTKAVGGFLENLMKLLGLLGLYFALSWLKGKDLKKLWDNFLKTIEDWKNILPEWTKNMTVPDWLRTSFLALGAAWAAWKGALKLAASGLSAVGNGLQRWFGIDAPFTKKLADLDLKVAKLTKQKAALQRSIKYATSLDEASELSKKLKLTNDALDLAKAEKTAVTRAQTLAHALSDEADLAKKLRDANLELAKTTKAEAAAQRAFNLGKDLAPDSPLAKKLAAASEELAKATKAAGVAEEAARLARETAKAAQKAADTANAAARPPGAPSKPKVGKPYQKQMRVGRTNMMRWWVEIDGKQVMISADQAQELGADITKTAKGLSGLKNLDVGGGGLWAEIKAMAGMSQEGNTFREGMEKLSNWIKNTAMSIPGAAANAPGIKQTLKLLGRLNPAFQAINVAEFGKGAMSAEKGMSAEAAGVGSVFDSWFTQIVKLGERFSPFTDKADFTWSNAMERYFSEYFGTILNRWGEGLVDSAGNPIWERDALGNILKDAEGKNIQKTAGITEQITKSIGMSGFDAIFKHGIPTSMINPKAIFETYLAGVEGKRFKTNLATGERTLVQTDDDSLVKSFEELGALMKAFILSAGQGQQQINTHLVNPTTYFSGNRSDNPFHIKE